MANKKIFIVGTGRSGTSVLKKIFGHHSQIFTYKKELRFISDQDGLMDLRNSLTSDWNPHNTDEKLRGFVDLITNHLFDTKLHDKVLNRIFQRTFSGFGRKYATVRMGNYMPKKHVERCLDEFMSSMDIESIPGYWYGSPSYRLEPTMYYSRPLNTEIFDEEAGKFVDTLLSYPLAEKQKTCWCDDTPMNILYADILCQMLENAKILHIYRNPLDVVASYSESKQSWAPADPVYAAGWIREIFAKWIMLRNNIPNKNYLEVEYEYLIANQEEGLRKIMDFIGLEFEESLLNLKLNANSVGRYKSDIPIPKIDSIESILTPVLKEYGYGSKTI